MLLNIVKLRYLEPPIFVDVGQIVAGYSLETAVTAGGTIAETDLLGGGVVSLGASGRFTDRPTITYTPLTGNRFVEGLMTPFKPESVFFAIQAGFPADAVLGAAAASINGLKNHQASLAGIGQADPGFLRAMQLMRKIQISGAVSVRVAKAEGGKPATIVALRSQDIGEETLADIAELRRLLRLDPETTDFTLVVGGGAANGKEIAVQTRSMLQILNLLASEATVPAAHLAETRVTPGWESVPGRDPADAMIRIQSSPERPDDAYVAVPFRDYWFWIDDRDLKSKRAFAFLLLLFTLADTGERAAPPLVTIPAQ